MLFFVSPQTTCSQVAPKQNKTRRRHYAYGVSHLRVIASILLATNSRLPLLVPNFRYAYNGGVKLV
jgi:hypothetical protein